MGHLKLIGRAVAAAGFMSAAPTFAQVSVPEAVETTQLAQDAFSSGTLSATEGALQATLWQGTRPQTLAFLLENLPTRPAAPSLGEVMRRTLLSSGTAPNGADASLGGKKLLALSRAGFADDAATIASLSSAERGDPWTGRAQAVSDLLKGDIQSACLKGQRLTSGRDIPFWVKLRVVCFALAGEGDAADLSLTALRDPYGLDPDEDIFLTAIATGAVPKSPPAARTPLEYAIARVMELPFSPGLLVDADGGVLVALSGDESADPATRIAAAERAVAMGVLPPAQLAALVSGIEFDVTDIAGATDVASNRPQDPLTDAVLYQSVAQMSAPEFLRDKAKRIALALSLADSFHRAYALSTLYSDEISELDGVILSADEAAQFALARMAVGDAAGAGNWLLMMLGPNNSVTALPEDQGLMFIDLVNLLALLDRQTAAQVARAGDVSLLGGGDAHLVHAEGPTDPLIAAQILEAAFDAALGGKSGQAGLAALAAARAGGANGPSEGVLIAQSLRAAGLEDLERRYRFEQAWANRYFTKAEDENSASAADERGFGPRLKPASSN